jgi:starch phosphorylase
MDTKRQRVAYFCMEFGLHEDFKIYSGGLGILAGDILKAAKDGGYPLVGVGILWRQGYVKQTIGADDKLYDSYAEQRYDFLEETGVTVRVHIRGRDVACKVWKCTAYGNVPLYLLDANLPENFDRLITGQLYGWFGEERIAQEMILGVGGMRALEALGIEVDVFHFNDSHPVLAGLELIRRKMEGGLPFEAAWEKTRDQIVFTTHTPVPAGNERHGHELLKYMGAGSGLTHDQMVALGGDPFSMTEVGLRLSRRANGVAELHGKTAREMWKNVAKAAPILSITNGVHNGTWQDKRVRGAYDGKGDLWEAHMAAKRELLAYVKQSTGSALSESALLVGFGRRAAQYKRADLIFRNRKIIEPLLAEGKLQLLFSGKAHPNDLGGKEIVMGLHGMAKHYPKSVAFLQDYDMKIGRLLTRGCDVWLNNPIRPMEASGTSGMKAAMNGVLNLSVLDGWWPEGCEHGVNGWQIGDAYEGPDADRNDSESLYRVLTTEVLPTYANRAKWVEMMRASIAMSQEKFSAARMVREYYDLMYTRTPQ